MKWIYSVDNKHLPEVGVAYTSTMYYFALQTAKMVFTTY